MRDKSESSEGSQDHYHMHYHYYYPSTMRNTSKEGKEKKSVSFSNEAVMTTPKGKSGRLRTEGDEINSLTEIKKMRLSEMGKLK